MVAWRLTFIKLLIGASPIHRFVTLNHSSLFPEKETERMRNKAVDVLGDFVSVGGGVKEDGSGGGRDLEEIITPLSNQEEVIWPVRLPQWILTPQ